MKGTPSILKPCSAGDACNWCGQPISADDARRCVPGIPFHEACRGSRVFKKNKV